MTAAAVTSLVNIAAGAVPRNQGLPLDLGWVNDVRVNLSAVERRVATLPGRRTVKKDAQAAWLLKAITCIDLTTLNGDDTAERVRAALRQGEGAGAAGYPGSAGLGRSRGDDRRGLRLSPLRRDGRRGAARYAAFPSRRCRPAFPAGLVPHDLKLKEIEASVARRRRGDRHRHHPRACADRQLAGALRRDARFPRGLRRGACEGDPRHRRSEDAAQCGPGVDGLHDGRRRFHQDLDRQGGRQRDAAGHARDAADDPRLSGAHRRSRSASSRPAASPRPRTCSTISS